MVSQGGMRVGDGGGLVVKIVVACPSLKDCAAWVETWDLKRVSLERQNAVLTLLLEKGSGQQYFIWQAHVEMVHNIFHLILCPVVHV